MKLKYAIVGTLVFVILLGLIHYIHITYFSVNVVFYAAIADVFFSVFPSMMLLFFLPYFHKLGSFEKTQLIFIWLLSGYGFAISVPTVIDRSLSFYILEKIQQRGGGIKQEKFEQVFTQEYVKEHRLVDVRLTEQLESGTIFIHDGCVKLTDKGKTIASFGRFYRQHLLPKKRLLMGKYSDDLTNPFRYSSDVSDYTCK